MKSLKESRSEFLRYLNDKYKPELVYYPASGADKTPKQVFGENKVIHLSLPENEPEAKYLERLGSGIKLFGDMSDSPLTDKSVDLIYLNLHGIPLSEKMVNDFYRVLKKGGLVTIEDRHVYDESKWNGNIRILEKKFTPETIDSPFSSEVVEYGVRPNKDYGRQQELHEEESRIVKSEEEMIELVTKNKELVGFMDQTRYSVMRKI